MRILTDSVDMNVQRWTTRFLKRHSVYHNAGEDAMQLSNARHMVTCTCRNDVFASTNGRTKTCVLFVGSPDPHNHTPTSEYVSRIDTIVFTKELTTTYFALTISSAYTAPRVHIQSFEMVRLHAQDLP